MSEDEKNLTDLVLAPYILRARTLNSGSRNAMLIKCADRITNLIDLHTDTHSYPKFCQILDHTEQYIIPMAQKVDYNMVRELSDLVARRRSVLKLIFGTDPECKQ